MGLFLSVSSSAAPVPESSGEPLERMALFIQAFNEPFDSVELIMEVNRVHRFTEEDAHRRLSRILRNRGDVYLSEEEFLLRRDQVLQALREPITDRYILYLAPGGVHRYEQIREGIDYSNLSEIGQISYGRAVIQGEHGHWGVDHGNQIATLSGLPRSPEQVIPALQAGWDECERFLHWRGVMNILEEIRGIEKWELRDGEVAATAVMADESIWRAQFGYKQNSPRSSILDWILIINHDRRSAGLWNFSDWESVNGLPRSLRAVESAWSDADLSRGVERRSLEAIPPDYVYTITAQRLSFNSPIDPEIFTFSPPAEYTVFERRADGSLFTVRDPWAEEMAARPPLPSPRQQRIQDRFASAQRPQRWTVAIAIFGGLLLALGVTLMIRRRIGE
jgi:hypothetical protein